MSNKARDWARSVTSLTASEAIVLRELSEYFNDAKGEAWPSMESLHQGCNGISERSIRRHLVTLMQRGIITRTQRGTRHQPSAYSFNFNRPTVASSTPSQPANHGTSTGQLGHLNRPTTVLQPANWGKSIRNEPLTTISKPLEPVVQVPELQPDIDDTQVDEFIKRTVAAFESNIHLMTPYVADQIKAIAESDRPPPDWGEKAVGEAAAANVREWRYVRGVLNRYIKQGNTDDLRKGARNGKRTDGIPGDGPIDVLRSVAAKQAAD